MIRKLMEPILPTWTTDDELLTGELADAIIAAGWRNREMWEASQRLDEAGE